MLTSANSTYDVARIREDFPALAMRVYGKPLVYLDNAASAQKPKAVLDRIQKAYTQEYANVHRGLHYLANAATDAYEGARETVRAFINAPRKEEVIFTRNATEAINLVAYTFGRERIKAGDEIVLSIMEHHSNIVPWHFLRERQGAVIKWAPVDDDGNFLIDEFEKLLTPRTKMVAITHMSNALGTIVPVKEVVKLAHARGIPVLVDGSQAAVHLPHSVQEYASSRLRQLRSKTSLAPKRGGGAVSVPAAGALSGSMAYSTSFCTAGMFFTLPSGSSRAKYALGKASRICRCLE